MGTMRSVGLSFFRSLPRSIIGYIPLLWNRTNSVSSTTISSDIGSNLTALNGPSFSATGSTTGPFGNAADLTTDTGIAIPAGVITPEEGCIEFWCYRTSNGFYNRLMSFNDSTIIIMWVGPPEEPTGTFWYIDTGDTGSLKYVWGVGLFGWAGGEANLIPPLNTWFHFALSWKKNPNAAIRDEMWITVDGVTVRATKHPSYAGEDSKIRWDTQFAMQLFRHPGWSFTGKVDNIKIWPYAKLDFSDRFTEGVVSPHVWYKLEDNLNAVVGSNGTAVGSPTYTTGKYNRGIICNSTTGFTTPFNGTTWQKKGTIEFWVYCSTANYQDYMNFFNCGQGRFVHGLQFFYYHPDRDFYLFNKNGEGWNWRANVTGFTVDTWHHFAFTWDNHEEDGVTEADLKVYIDGVASPSAPTYAGGPTPHRFDWHDMTTLAFGVQNSTGVTVNPVTIDNVKIWDFVKTDFSDSSVEGTVSGYTAEQLIVGGGGGGSSGGGGAGGVYPDKKIQLESHKIYSVVVGDGGLGAGTSTAPGGSTGEDSIFSAFKAKGGGWGGAIGDVTGGTGAGGIGGSGGGGGAYSGGTTVVGTPLYNQGFRGGNNQGYTPPPYPSAGGGGAGDHSVDNVTGAQGGGGGPGVNTFATWFSDILAGGGPSLGVSGYIAGGGGGTVWTGAGSPGGGQHGGGNGTTSGTGGAGTANTGGGGGAAASPGPGGKGGSGLVIIRYSGAARGTGGDSVVTYGGYTYHVWTSVGSSTYKA